MNSAPSTKSDSGCRGGGSGLLPLPAAMKRVLRRLGQEELTRRRQRLARSQAALGLHYAAGAGTEHHEPAFALDLTPLVLPESEWDRLSAAVIQRARAFDLFVRDIYGEQKILRERALPYSLVLRDPAFLREISELNPGDRHHVLFGAVDLCRTSGGEWQVLENYFALPFGLSYALQNRHMLADALPELLTGEGIHSLDAFAGQMVEALRALSPARNPRVVLLTGRNEPGQSFFEESLLARHMGIPIVTPDDLLVRENRVHLKTVGGLEQVDVIYRRIRSTSMDPVSFGSTSGEGVPGLMSCLRKGTVAVSNGLGSGIADNKALLRYSDRIIRHYLGESPLLKTVPTYDCGDPDQAELVRQHRAAMTLKPVQSTELLRHFLQARFRNGSDADPNLLLKIHPEYIAAQQKPELSRSPRHSRGSWVDRPFYLRCFFLLGDRPQVLPGGLCLQSTRQNEDKHFERFSGSKDIWIQAGGKRSERTKSETVFPTFTDDLPIGSRSAECLYWIGRYTERAENTARMLLVLEECSGESARRTQGAVTRALWKAVAEATGQDAGPRRRPTRNESSGFIGGLLHDARDPASVLRCLRAARDNTQITREFVTPEVWTALLQALAPLEKPYLPKRVSRDTLRETCRNTVRRLAELRGTASRTMPRDESWHFYRMGKLMERAQATLEVSMYVLREIERLNGEEEADPFLVSLLRMLGSLDAYRRTYRSRPQPDRVAALIWLNEENPGSIGYCLASLRSVLDALQTTIRTDEYPEITRAMDRIRKRLRRLPDRLLADNGDQPDGLPKESEIALGKAYERLANELNGIHKGLEDNYFNHAFLGRPNAISSGSSTG